MLSISDYPVYAGVDVMMTCVLANGDGNPPVTSFSWFHNSQLTDQTSVNSTTVSLVNINQDGDYSCQGVNLVYSGWLESDMSEQELMTVRRKIHQRCKTCELACELQSICNTVMFGYKLAFLSPQLPAEIDMCSRYLPM